MIASSRILAIDCGTSRVLAGRFSRDRAGRLTLVRSRVEWLPRRDRTEAGWWSETAAALATLARRESLGGACVVGLPGHLTFCRLVAVPGVAKRRRRQIIGFELRQGVPLPAGEVAWAQAPIRLAAGGEEVMLTAIRRSTIEAVRARLGAAGLYPVAVLPAWQVLWESLACSHAGAALAVAIGARSTQLIHAGAAGSFIRTLALGGDAVTERIADESGLEFARAEALKLETGPATSDAAPARAAVRLAADEFGRRLGGEISRSLAGLPSGAAGRPDRVLLSGGGALLDGLPERLADELHLPVSRRDPWPALDAAAGGAGATNEVAPPLLGDLVGLAAAHGGPAAGNLLPRSLRWTTYLGRHRSALAAAAALLAIALGGAIGRETMAANAARDRAAAVERAIEQLRRLDHRNRENLEELAAMRRRTDALERLVTAKQEWIGLLADLQDRLAQAGDAWLERLQVILPTRPQRPAGAGSARGKTGLRSLEPDPRSLPVRIGLAGCLFDPGHPLGPVGPEAFERARAVLTRLRASPFVAALEHERFDGGRAGILRFEVTLVLAPGKLR